MRLASSSGRIRKSPFNHLVVVERIRNPALRFIASRISTFPQAILKKEKEPKRKKPRLPLFLPLNSLSESNYKGNSKAHVDTILAKEFACASCVPFPIFCGSGTTSEFCSYPSTRVPSPRTYLHTQLHPADDA